MPVSDNIDPVFMKSLPFKITLDMIKNLGVVAPKNPKDLVQLNYFAHFSKQMQNTFKISE